jgi:hypothetical protein
MIDGDADRESAFLGVVVCAGATEDAVAVEDSFLSSQAGDIGRFATGSGFPDRERCPVWLAVLVLRYR